MIDFEDIIYIMIGKAFLLHFSTKIYQATSLVACNERNSCYVVLLLNKATKGSEFL